MPHRLNMRVPTGCQNCGWRPQHMFCNLAPEALADFSAIGHSLTLPTSAILFHEGDPSDRIYILCDGKVKLSCASRDGKTLNLRIALPGDVLGLSAVVSGSAFEVMAEAIVPVAVKLIPATDFLPFLQRHGEASMHAAKALSEEYKSAYSEARRLALSGSVTGRIAGLLLDWGRSASCANAPANGPLPNQKVSSASSPMRFTMVLTHDDLASFTGTSRETVTRSLSRLQKDRLIEIHGASIHILEPTKLEALSAA